MEIILRYSSKTLVYSIILIVVMLAAAVLLIVLPEEPQGYIFGAVIFALVAAVVMVQLFKEIKRCRKTVVISPEGIKTEEGELLEAAAIDHCYLHFCDMFISGGKYNSLDKSFYRLVVKFKDGKTKTIDLEDYGISFNRAKNFHQEVNAIPGMPLFKEPVIENL